MNNSLKYIKLIAAILGSLGVVITTAQSFVNLHQMLEKNFWFVLISAWLLSVIALWPKPSPRASGFTISVKAGNSLSKIRWILLVSLVFCAIGIYRFYEIHIRKTAAELSVPSVPVRSSRKYFEEIAKPAPSLEIIESDRIRLRQFELSEATSYTEDVSPFAGASQKWYKTYNGGKGFTPRRCDEQISPIIEPLKEAFRRFAEKHNRTNLLVYVESDVQVRRLHSDRPDIADKLIPKLAEEWSDMSGADYSTYTKWISSCIGIQYPAFNVTIENLTNEEQLITKVIYRVSDVGQVMGGAEGLLAPNETYMHVIMLRVGDQEAPLVPPFRIPPRSSASFELQLSTKDPDWGLCWLMKIYFITEQNQNVLKGVATDEFQLVMSGKPEPKY